MQQTQKCPQAGDTAPSDSGGQVGRTILQDDGLEKFDTKQSFLWVPFSPAERRDIYSLEGLRMNRKWQGPVRGWVYSENRNKVYIYVT